jgi:surface antigen
MRHWTTVSKMGVVGLTLVLGVPFVSHNALAARTSHAGHGTHQLQEAPTGHHGADRPLVQLVSTHVHAGAKTAIYTMRKGHKGPVRIGSSGSYGISCVPYAREVSGIALTGNAVTWWDEAAGVYARGNAPEPGSVLNFRANSSMRLGHVAVVSTVLSRREIEIDHANWWGPGASKGGISRNISVVDVSPNNDWSAVRVGLGHTGEYGSIYATYGFIYPRPDNGRTGMMTATSHSYGAHGYDEVAEAPDGKAPTGLTLDVPDRRIQ